MKRRKGNSFLSARKIESIADKVYRSKYSYNQFKQYIFSLIYNSALKGQYNISIDITDFNKEYFSKLEAELKDKNYTTYIINPISGGIKITIGWKTVSNINITNPEVDEELIKKLNNELTFMLNSNHGITGYNKYHDIEENKYRGYY